MKQFPLRATHWLAVIQKASLAGGTLVFTTVYKMDSSNPKLSLLYNLHQALLVNKGKLLNSTNSDSCSLGFTQNIIHGLHCSYWTKKGTKYISVMLGWKCYYHKCPLCGKKSNSSYTGFKHYCTGHLPGISTTRAPWEVNRPEVSQRLQKGPSEKYLWSVFVEESKQSIMFFILERRTYPN